MGQDQHIDEVDRIVAAWRRERPSLDVTPLQVLSRVSRLARLLDIARRKAFAVRGLESGEFDVLSALRRAGEPHQLTPTQLVKQTLVTSGTMTNRITRLAARGLVERTSSESDARSVFVTLTDAGRDIVDAAMDELVAGEQEILAVLNQQEQDQVAGLLKRVLGPFDEDE